MSRVKRLEAIVTPRLRTFVRAMCAAWFSLAGPLHAQDLAGSAPAGDPDLFALLEHALPARERGLAAAAATTRWWGLRELETRAVALGGSAGAVRIATGLSQTGAPELGWTTLALAAGGVTRGGGAAVRVVTRHDRDQPWSAARALEPRSGLVVGAGAWLEPAPSVRVWASAPQMRARGQPPPLDRTLELGVRAGGATAAWCTLRAPRANDDGERSLGLVLALAPFEAWAEVRDGPLRGAAGLRASAGRLRVGARADAHPVLGETLRVSLEWCPAAAVAP